MADRDQLKPTAQQVKNALDKARSYWHDLADNASSLDRSISPEEMLFRVPALPARPIKISTVSFGSSSTKVVLSAASSISRVTEGSKCSVGEKVKKTRDALLLGIDTSVLCTWLGSVFRHRSWSSGGQGTVTNYVGILSLAWAYILSARLVEMQQQKGSEILYTDAQAPNICRTLVDELPTDFNVNIGKVDSGAARWWAALLAPGQGWKAIFTQQENTSYAAPWSVVLDGKQRIGIVWEDVGITVDGVQCDDPPTSQAALSMLTKICLMHDLGDQFYAAFAAALIFPTHNHHKIIIELPFPTTYARRSQIALSDTSAEEYMAIDNKIPFYISLGCNHNVVVSSLCGSFWEPDIPCNLVSPWLHPVLKELPYKDGVNNIPGRYFELIALISGIRRPSISTLWVGAAISGLISRILRLVQGGACGENVIQRADAWRLLYLPTTEEDGLHYENFPFSPWHPVERTTEKYCALRVFTHKSCSRHRLEYQYWTWQLSDSSEIEDQGFRSSGPFYNDSRFKSPATNPSIPPIVPELDDTASQEASMEVFRWVLANHEGRPPEPIYDDEWLDGCESSDEPEEALESDTDKEERSPIAMGPSDDFNQRDAMESQISIWMNNVA